MNRAIEIVLKKKLNDYINNLKKFAFGKVEHDDSRTKEFSNEILEKLKCLDGFFILSYICASFLAFEKP